MNRALSPLQPLVRSFLEQVAAQRGPPLEQLPPEAARAAVIAAQAVPVSLPAVDVELRSIAGVPCYIYRPAGKRGLLPAAIYFHGGGWVLCNHETHDRLMRELAAKAGVALVFVEYSLAPEARYPAALAEAFSVTRYLAEHGEEYGIDSTRLAISGDSGGATLATSVAMLATRRGSPRLRMQLLFFPVTDSAMDTQSYREFAEGYFLTRAQMQWFWDCYVPNRAQRNEAAASPLRATLDELRGMPPALVITADHDVLRDEGEAYARRLAEAGVSVTATRYPGTIHAFVVLNAFTQDRSPRRAIEQAAQALEAALVRGETRAMPVPEETATANPLQ